MLTHLKSLGWKPQIQVSLWQRIISLSSHIMWSFTKEGYITLRLFYYASWVSQVRFFSYYTTHSNNNTTQYLISHKLHNLLLMVLLVQLLFSSWIERGHLLVVYMRRNHECYSAKSSMTKMNVHILIWEMNYETVEKWFLKIIINLVLNWVKVLQ